MAKKEQPKPRKYVIKNVHKGPVHIKELRKALSPQKEHPFEGVLGEGTQRLRDQGLVEIQDLGESTKVTKPSPLERKAEQEKKERELTKEVRKNLDKLPKKESGGSAEPVKADDTLDKAPVIVSPPKEDTKSRLDAIVPPSPEEVAKSKKKKKSE